MSQRSSVGRGLPVQHKLWNLRVGSGLGIETASGSISGMDTLAGFGFVVALAHGPWWVGSGFISMAGSGVELRSAVKDLAVQDSPGWDDESHLEQR